MSTKLVYFNLRGKGELIRLILICGGENFEDKRVSFDEWYNEVKPTLKYGQLPVYENVDGHCMNESIAISRYLAKKYGLYGTNDWESYLIDRAVDTISDLKQYLGKAHFEKDMDLKQKMQKEIEEIHIPTTFKKLTLYIEEEKGDFFNGSKPSFADFCLITILDQVPSQMDNFPKLKNAYNKILEYYPVIREYIDTRPKTEI